MMKRCNGVEVANMTVMPGADAGEGPELRGDRWLEVDVTEENMPKAVSGPEVGALVSWILRHSLGVMHT